MSTRLGIAYRWVRDALRAADLASPETDARLLVADVTGLSPQRLVLEETRPLSEAEEARLEAHLAARLERKPVGRIVGHRDFWGLNFELSPETLEPRPDTETLVEAALAFVDETGDRERPLNIVDLGTGTGAILVALLSELPNARGLATDIQPGALHVARRNAAACGVGDRMDFACTSWMEGVGGGWDLIVSNPPYIRSGIIPGLDPEVREHDPLTALDGGEDGLAPYRVIARDSAEKLRETKAAVIVEIGYDQEQDVISIFREAAFNQLDIVRDLAERDRVVGFENCTWIYDAKGLRSSRRGAMTPVDPLGIIASRAGE
ncbi:peptide chain release factor N(5)-glutamine methyltransferase [Breoghania sp.]|uniref:peptide chain release factor N(5)-glutamine methyltransferase n=1 Tax=Breoghania sp. TaxID=2065378 RepID=UPI002608EC4B|nr:peptide chain release factor N(5)-glutamine methyltransferase [Breoghania sp.]MDJ0932540.1 peptide chain release factor N(5)-glutamine methyltransferase [Breoghania sp.]